MASRVRRTVLSVLAIIVLLAAAAAGYYYGRIVPLVKAGKTQGTYSLESARRSVAAFTFETADGTRRSIADLRGNVVVVDVWATWCGTCIRNFPSIAALRNKYIDKTVKIIGLDVDKDGWKKVKPFLQNHPEINYGVAVPSPSPSFLIQSIVDLSPLGETSAIPTVFVVDRQGRLAGKFIELGHEQEIDQLVGSLLNE